MLATMRFESLPLHFATNLMSFPNSYLELQRNRSLLFLDPTSLTDVVMDAKNEYHIAIWAPASIERSCPAS